MRCWSLKGVGLLFRFSYLVGAMAFGIDAYTSFVSSEHSCFFHGSKGAVSSVTLGMHKIRSSKACEKHLE